MSKRILFRLNDFDNTLNFLLAPSASADVLAREEEKDALIKRMQREDNAYYSDDPEARELYEQKQINKVYDAYVPCRAEREFFFRRDQKRGVVNFYASQCLLWLLVKGDKKTPNAAIKMFRKLFPTVAEKILTDTFRLLDAIKKPKPSGKVDSVLKRNLGNNYQSTSDWLTKVADFKNKNIFIAAVCDVFECESNQVSLYNNDQASYGDQALAEDFSSALPLFVTANPLNTENEYVETNLTEILRVEFLYGSTAADIIKDAARDPGLSALQRKRLCLHPAMLAKLRTELYANLPQDKTGREQELARIQKELPTLYEALMRCAVMEMIESGLDLLLHNTASEEALEKADLLNVIRLGNYRAEKHDTRFVTLLIKDGPDKILKFYETIAVNDLIPDSIRMRLALHPLLIAQILTRPGSLGSLSRHTQNAFLSAALEQVKFVQGTETLVSNILLPKLQERNPTKASEYRALIQKNQYQPTQHNQEILNLLIPALDRDTLLALYLEINRFYAAEAVRLQFLENPILLNNIAKQYLPEKPASDGMVADFPPDLEQYQTSCSSLFDALRLRHFFTQGTAIATKILAKRRAGEPLDSLPEKWSRLCEQLQIKDSSFRPLLLKWFHKTHFDIGSSASSEDMSEVEAFLVFFTPASDDTYAAVKAKLAWMSENEGNSVSGYGRSSDVHLRLQQYLMGDGRAQYEKSICQAFKSAAQPYLDRLKAAKTGAVYTLNPQDAVDLIMRCMSIVGSTPLPVGMDAAYFCSGFNLESTETLLPLINFQNRILGPQVGEAFPLIELDVRALFTGAMVTLFGLNMSGKSSMVSERTHAMVAALLSQESMREQVALILATLYSKFTGQTLTVCQQYIKDRISIYLAGSKSIDANFCQQYFDQVARERHQVVVVATEGEDNQTESQKMLINVHPALASYLVSAGEQLSQSALLVESLQRRLEEAEEELQQTSLGNTPSDTRVVESLKETIKNLKSLIGLATAGQRRVKDLEQAAADKRFFIRTMIVYEVLTKGAPSLALAIAAIVPYPVDYLSVAVAVFGASFAGDIAACVPRVRRGVVHGLRKVGGRLSDCITPKKQTSETVSESDEHRQQLLPTLSGSRANV